MSAHSGRGPPIGWALTAFSAVCIVGGVFFIEAGLRAEGGEDVILEVETAVAEAPVSTVAPALPAADLVEAPPEVAVEARAPEGDANAELPVEVRELRVPDEATGARPRPVGLGISTIDVSTFPVRPVGLQDNGQLEIPDETEIGWYKYGATAGAPGATVLAAHVNWRGSNGPFARLGSVEPGDEIEVALHDGSTRSYVVTERTMYGKLDLPRERLWRNTGDEELVLITCGGDFNPELHSYKHNIVVYAAPVG
ncbi:MAG: class F sortase [Ilumatobacteraceae bacterium]